MIARKMQLLALATAVTAQSVRADNADLTELLSQMKTELQAEYDAKLAAATAKITETFEAKLQLQRETPVLTPTTRGRRRLNDMTSVEAFDVLDEDVALISESVDAVVESVASGEAGCPSTAMACADANSASAMSSCCNDGDWDMVYQLDILDAVDYNTYDDIGYTVDNSASFETGSFKRIAYHLQLDDEWVFVSMDAFTDDAAMTGIPVDWTHDNEEVTGLSIQSSSAAIADLVGMEAGTGSLELWHNCYSTGDDGVYSGDDVLSGDDCYGSFQVHSADGTVIFAYNRWSNGGTGDLGIGNNPDSEHIDWTFASNVGDYTVRTLTVFVSDTRQYQADVDGLEADVEGLEADVEALEADVEALLNAETCSYENDINGRCGDPTVDFQMQNCCDGGGWEVVYQLNIEDSANYDAVGDVPYTVDNSANFEDGSFWRIGYHLQLDDEWVFASMNAFTESASYTGIPVDWEFDEAAINGLHITSNAASLRALTGTVHLIGDVEFWSNCYGSGDDGVYSGDDAASSEDCYGSFQIHTEDGSNIFSYNGWSHSSNNDLGIGDNPNSDHIDWTFENNAASYSVKTLTVFLLRM